MEQVMDSTDSKDSRALPHAGSDHPLTMTGLAGLITATRQYINEEDGDSDRVVRRLAEDFAFIHLSDVRNPLKFLRQMEGFPPIRLGTKGFRREVVDDKNPARHYIAFVALGYWLPYWVAIAVLYLWEVAGYIRYRFKWSKADMLSGLTGVRHGNMVRRQGVDMLPELMVADLADEEARFPSFPRSGRSPRGADSSE